MGRVLIIGLDGATWDILEPWARQGRLPSVARLMERGTWGTLRSTVPPLTLPAWSSFMTGRNPGSHGVFAFRRLATRGYETGGLASAADLHGATMWDVAGRAGKHVGVISVPPSYPLRPVNGFIVGCMLTPPGEPLAHPPEVAAELGAYEVDPPAPRGLRRGAPDYLARGLPYLEKLREQSAQRLDVTLRLMRRRWDLLCVVFYAPDRIQHYFWPYVAAPNGLPDEEPAVRRALDTAYAELDAAVGRLTDAAGPETTAFLVSDHGFASKPEWAIHLNRWLADHRFLCERPFWRLRRRVVRKIVSRERRAAFDTADRMVDMSRTRAWAQTLEPGTAGIWINARGRYPLGCVSTEEYEAVREAIRHGLTALRDEEGRPVLATISRREDLYRGPHAGDAPDLVAVCDHRFGVVYESLRRDLRARRLFGPFEELGFTGTHHADGMYLVAGSPVRTLGRSRDYPIEAIAPTALHLLGVPVPRSMEGEMCTALLTDEFLAEHPVRFSDDEAESLRQDDGWKSAEDEARVAEHLRALGYVE